MAKFKFKLETVLKVKTRVEELRQKELKETEVRRDAARIELARREKEAADTALTYREQLRANLDIRRANDYARFLTWLNHQVDLAVRELQQCEAAVTAARERLILAAKEKKVLEKLKQKAYEAYKAEELNAEIKFLDELGTEQYLRQQIAAEQMTGRQMAGEQNMGKRRG
ncbi:MAG TPA: flagellar export protein FliJ [Bacillota bacterium]